jgi:hypothetical protein
MKLYEADAPADEAETASPQRPASSFSSVIGRVRICLGISEIIETKALEKSPVAAGDNDNEDRLANLRQLAPIGLGECERCGYLEKLTVTQQNDLMSNKELSCAYQEVKALMKEEQEEELKLPAHYRLEYDHRNDKFQKSIDPKIEDVAVDLPTNLKFGQGGLNPHEAEHLRMVILGLNEKLKGMQML